MFNFQETEDLTKIKRIQEESVVVGSNGSVRINQEALELLGIKNGRKVHILKDKSGNIAIAGVKEDAEHGKTVNEQGKFTNKNLAKALGGQYSAWNIVGEPMNNPVTGDDYYTLKEEVNGAEKRAELNEAAGITSKDEESSEEISAKSFDDEDEVDTSSAIEEDMDYEEEEV